MLPKQLKKLTGKILRRHRPVGLLVWAIISSCHGSGTDSKANVTSSSALPDPSIVTLASPTLPQNVDQSLMQQLLKKGGFESRFLAWNGKLLINRVMDSSKTDTDQLYTFNALYLDSNRNLTQDQGDAGFFNPASTVKVGIAILALEKLKSLDLPKETEYQFNGRGNWFSLEADIQQAMVISDNEATNRLIQFIGFTPLNRQLRAKGIETFAVNRLMLDRGTLVQGGEYS